MSKIILQDVIDQSVTDTLTETNLFVGTIPGGVWVGKCVVIEQTGRYVNSGNSQTYTIRLYVGSSGGAGGTEVSEFSWNTASSALGHAAVQRWELYALDADSLRVVCRGGHGGPGSDDGSQASASTPTTFHTNRVEGLSGLTGDTEIRMTVQLNSITGTTHSFTSRGVWVGLLEEAVTATTYTNATETDTAGVFTAKVAYGVALETDTAGAFQSLSTAYTHALETDTARAFNVRRGYGVATEADTAGTFTSVGGSVYSMAQETDTARGFGIKIGYGPAIETDTAWGFGIKVPYTHASEADTAGVFAGASGVIILPLILSKDGPTAGGAAGGGVLVSSREGA